MCGVSNRCGHPARTLPAGSGSCSKTSSAAPPSMPLRSASASAVSSTMPPREVLIRIASRFISASRRASRRRRVSSVSGRCSETTSDSCSRSSSGRGAVCCSAHAAESGAIALSKPSTCMPSRWASSATRRPILPKPTTPSVLPESSRPCDSAARGHWPAATAVLAPKTRRRSTNATPITYSATERALAPVAGMTSIRRAAQADRSMLSSPTPSRPTTLRRGAAASRAAFTCVRLRTINASALASSTPSSAGRSTSAASYRTSKSRASDVAAASSMNSLMTIRTPPGSLRREQLVDVLEGLELERVVERVEQEHRRLLADLSLESHVRLDDEAHARRLQTVGQAVPFVDFQDHAEMPHRHLVAVDQAGRHFHVGGADPERHDLVAEEIEIHPFLGAAALGAAEHAAVEAPCDGEVGHREGQMKPRIVAARRLCLLHGLGTPAQFCI